MTTDGSVVDYATVEDYIKSCGKKFEIRQIAMDRWNGTATASRRVRYTTIVI